MSNEMLGGGATGVKGFARWKEFETVKRIVPVSLKNMEGDGKVDEKFLDSEGRFRRLTFKDLDNGDVERRYDDPFENFKQAVAKAMEAKIFVKGVVCRVHWEKNEKNYTEWIFEKDE